MKRTKINNLQIGKKVKLQGFVQELRKQSKICFVLLREKSGIVQLVISAKSKAFEKMSQITRESVISVIGEVKEAVVKTEQVTKNDLEILVEEIEILSLANPVLPIEVIEEKVNSELSQRFNYRWIELRKPQNLKLFQVWTELEKGFREYFDKNEFVQIYTPSLMGTESESGAGVFELEYFGKKAFLAQSPQFYKQMAMASGFEKVFVVGPVFRAEKSHTKRHATEFTGWDCEISYISEIEELMDIEEKLIVEGFKKLKLIMPEIEIPACPFPRITLEQAKSRLKKANVVSEEGGNLSPGEERELWKLIKKEFGHEFVFVTEYPVEVRPFYHMRFEKRPNLTKSYDLMYRGIEITTAAIREHRVEILEKQAMEKGMSVESISEYLEFFRYGCPPHGGFGIGPVRLISKILNLESIHEATFLPRTPDRLNP